MVCYTGMISTFGISEKLTDEPSTIDLGPDFAFKDVERLVEEAFSEFVVTKQILVSNGCLVIAFLHASNHERGVRKALFRLFEELAQLGSGIHAFCSMYDDEADNGNGRAWELRLNHPDTSIDGIDIDDDTPVERIDYTKRDWPRA